MEVFDVMLLFTGLLCIWVTFINWLRKGRRIGNKPLRLIHNVFERYLAVVFAIGVVMAIVVLLTGVNVIYNY